MCSPVSHPPSTHFWESHRFPHQLPIITASVFCFGWVGGQKIMHPFSFVQLRLTTKESCTNSTWICKKNPQILCLRLVAITGTIQYTRQVRCTHWYDGKPAWWGLDKKIHRRATVTCDERHTTALSWTKRYPWKMVTLLEKKSSSVLGGQNNVTPAACTSRR